jgi:hypothetical protein
MSDIQQRIANFLLREGYHPDDAAEAAEILVSELGLTREDSPLAIDFVDGMPSGEFHRASRYVTEWVPVLDDMEDA